MPLKVFEIVRKSFGFIETNQYDINKEQSKPNEDERFEKWIIFLLSWLFFPETLALVGWVTGGVLTGWLSNEMGTV